MDEEPDDLDQSRPDRTEPMGCKRVPRMPYIYKYGVFAEEPRIVRLRPVIDRPTRGIRFVSEADERRRLEAACLFANRWDADRADGPAVDFFRTHDGRLVSKEDIQYLERHTPVVRDYARSLERGQEEGVREAAARARANMMTLNRHPM